ncbi:hypothetical protein HPB49_000099 [Dermacentor silvarum]|uniref:Uncharacterized protein n=1 Tax=Dermacentor silvarum TaxID=543639 RepID=A0ACB8C6H0_DERSI|nr:hypothetical protein HPB49_000099 [Dermacentor silvarum]
MPRPRLLSLLLWHAHYACTASYVTLDVLASGRFLCLVLEDGQACSELEARVTNSDPRLVQAWLRCCIGVKPPNSEMTRLSRIVLGRKEFANYNSLVGTMVPSDEVTAHDDLVVYFLDCLAQYADIVSAMDGISSLSQLRQSVACYLRDFVAVATAQLRNSAAAAATRDSLGNVYHLCGQLFRLCAGLIYTRGMADCVLPRLLDSLILPGALYAGKLIPQAQLAAIKQHLPLQTQSSIHHTGEHPLLATLESCGGACRAAAERRAAYVGFLLDFIQKHFVAKKSVSGTHLNQALRFLLELLKHLAPLKKDCRSVLQSGLPNLLKSLGMLSGDARTNRELMSQVMRAVTMFSSVQPLRKGLPSEAANNAEESLDAGAGQCDDSNQEFFLGSLTVDIVESASSDWFESVQVNGRDVNFKLYTGFDVNTLSEQLVLKWKPQPTVTTTKAKVTTYLGEQLNIEYESVVGLALRSNLERRPRATPTVPTQG